MKIIRASGEWWKKRPFILKAVAKVTVYGGKIELVSYPAHTGKVSYLDATRRYVASWRFVRRVLVLGSESLGDAIAAASTRLPVSPDLQDIGYDGGIEAIGTRLIIGSGFSRNKAGVAIRWE